MNWHTLFFGRKGLAIMAISGVDLALWDLRAKAVGRSVAELLSAGPPRIDPDALPQQSDPPPEPVILSLDEDPADH